MMLDYPSELGGFAHALSATAMLYELPYLRLIHTHQHPSSRSHHPSNTHPYNNPIIVTFLNKLCSYSKKQELRPLSLQWHGTAQGGGIGERSGGWAINGRSSYGRGGGGVLERSRATEDAEEPDEDIEDF